VRDQHSILTATIGIQIKLCTIQKVARQILTPVAEDGHLETKRSYEGEPSGTTDDSAPPLVSGLIREQHRRTFASDGDASKVLNAFKKAVKVESAATSIMFTTVTFRINFTP
jgi:hypothetical protein